VGKVTASSDDPVEVKNPIDDMAFGLGADTVTIELTGRFYDPFGFARFNTVLGTIDMRLFKAETPQTVENFLNYVNKGAYTNSFIHRSAIYSAPPYNPFVIQGGGFGFYDFEDEDPETTDYIRIPTDPPVVNEPGISNLRGTIAMAKLSGDPDSATSQWFFNLSDNSTALDGQNGGFTVFGEVINDGMTVVDAISAAPRWDARVINSAFGELPLIDYAGAPPLPDETHLVMVHSIDEIELSVTVHSDNPGLIAASINDSALQLNFAEDRLGLANITVTATAFDGRFAKDAFTVVVGGDLNGSGQVNLADAMLGLGLLAGIHPAELRPDYGSSGADVDGDDKVGIEEVIYILEVVSQIW
jgi:cyclophilin family peptidyl-prolyl cis-trans isomerase